MNIGVILCATVQTGEYLYTNIYKTVYIDVPEDGCNWHVAGEEYRENATKGGIE